MFSWMGVLIWTMLGLGVIQVGLVLAFLSKFVFWKHPCVADSELPRAAVLMGLRGADPFLGESLKKLMRQDYPDYDLWIVVDSRTDPAWEVVERVIAETGSTHVHMLEFEDVPENGPINCTNSKVVQAVRQLDDSYEMIAMSDGDSNVSATWLKQLVSPMIHNEKLAVTFGLHWFIPIDGALGAITRHLFNAGGSVLMAITPMPWGGCYCIRASVMRKLNLIEEWSKVVALDASTTRLLAGSGYDVTVVPTLMIHNFETCKLSFCLNWAHRQLLWMRLYHADWNSVLAHTTVLTLPPTLTALAGMYAAVIGNWQMLGVAASALFAYWALLLMLNFVLTIPVHRVIRKRGISTRWLTPINLFKLWLMIPVAQIIYTTAVLRATFQRRVAWRGITFEVIGSGKFRVLEKQEYEKTAVLAGSVESL